MFTAVNLPRGPLNSSKYTKTKTKTFSLIVEYLELSVSVSSTSERIRRAVIEVRRQDLFFANFTYSYIALKESSLKWFCPLMGSFNFDALTLLPSDCSDGFFQVVDASSQWVYVKLRNCEEMVKFYHILCSIRAKSSGTLLERTTSTILQWNEVGVSREPIPILPRRTSCSILQESLVF